MENRRTLVKFLCMLTTTYMHILLIFLYKLHFLFMMASGKMIDSICFATITFLLVVEKFSLGPQPLSQIVKLVIVWSFPPLAHECYYGRENKDDWLLL